MTYCREFFSLRNPKYLKEKGNFEPKGWTLKFYIQDFLFQNETFKTNMLVAK